jgi:hypothetical protein
MNLIERVKNILLTPKTEWDVVNGESATPMSLLTGYVLPLAVVAAVGTILKGVLFTGVLSLGIKYYLIAGIIAFIATIVAFYLTVIIMDMLAPSFSSEKDLNKTAQLVAYSATPSYVAGILGFIPILGMLAAIAGWVYGIYLMYLGIGPLKKTPEDKKIVYMLVVYVILIVIYFILIAVLGAILFAAMGFGVASLGGY